MPRRPGSVPPELAVRRTQAEITFVYRPGCPICERVRRVVDAAARRYKLRVEAVDLEQEPKDISEKWRFDLPVILIDGKRKFSGHLDAARFEKALQSRRP